MRDSESDSCSFLKRSCSFYKTSKHTQIFRVCSEVGFRIEGSQFNPCHEGKTLRTMAFRRNGGVTSSVVKFYSKSRYRQAKFLVT
jgi:hypothetical protein